MKAEPVRRGRVWLPSAALLAGLAYSVLALTLSSKPVYASSCDCQETLTDAGYFCESHGWAPVIFGSYHCYPKRHGGYFPVPGNWKRLLVYFRFNLERSFPVRLLGSS
jgi:hypothetical protein